MDIVSEHVGRTTVKGRSEQNAHTVQEITTQGPKRSEGIEVRKVRAAEGLSFTEIRIER